MELVEPYIVLFGNPELSLGGVALKLSRRGLALLVYLLLTEQPQHRETLAALLWTGPQSMNNLRVELSKLRAAGLNLGPPGAPLVGFTAQSDLRQWLSNPKHALEQTKAPLGLPLEGLSEVGGAAYQAWVNAQRQRLIGLLAPALRSAALAEAPPETKQLVWESAARLGIDLVAQPEPKASTELPDSVSLAVRSALKLSAKEPQLLVYSGRPGSGRSAALSDISTAEGWLMVTVEVIKHPDLLVASLIMRIFERLPPADQPLLTPLINSTEAPEAKLIQLASLLLTLQRPLMVLLHGTRMLSQASAQHLEFLMNWPVPLLIVLMPSVADTAPLLRLLEGQAKTRNRLTLKQPRLSVAALESLVTPWTSAERTATSGALKVLQQSEGWLAAAQAFLTSGGQPPAALAVAGRAAPLAAAGRRRLGQRLSGSAGLAGGAANSLHRSRSAQSPSRQPECCRGAGGVDPGTGRQNPGAVSCAHHGADAAADLADSRRQRSTRVRQRIAAGRVRRNPGRQHQGAAAPGAGRQSCALGRKRRCVWQSAPETGGQIAPAPSAQRSTWLPSGYHLIIEAGHLHVLRLGVPHPMTQELNLRWRAPAGLPWVVTARLGAFTGNRSDYPLGVCLQTDQQVLTPPHLPPFGEAFTISGLTTDTGLELIARASDLILTIEQVSIDGQVVAF